MTDLSSFSLGFDTIAFERTRAVKADCFDWLAELPENSVHAVVTDPPYGVREYEHHDLTKRENGKGGTWRIPPSFDGSTRAPLPRFTDLKPKELLALSDFFRDWAALIARALRPGGHVFIASNAFLSQPVFASLVDGGLEFRGELIRLVQTLRGGDRPKNAHIEFPDVCSLPRGGYEPWGIFRSPMPPKMRVADCLRQWQTGGLRRRPDGKPFADVIASERTPKAERDIAGHPSLKPQSLLRQIVHAALPLGDGVVLDPFMGSGSTLAAVEAVGYSGIGVERRDDYFEMSRSAVPRLAAEWVMATTANGRTRGRSSPPRDRVVRPLAADRDFEGYGSRFSEALDPSRSSSPPSCRSPMAAQSP